MVFSRMPFLREYRFFRKVKGFTLVQFNLVRLNKT
jgi:hypothetical protein